MKREELEKLGLSEEQINAIMAKHGQALSEVNAKLSAAEDNNKALQTQLTDRDKDLKALKKEATDNADLQQKYTDLETKYKQEKADYDQKLKDTAVNHAVDMALVGKVHNAKVVRGLLDRSKLSVDDNGVLAGLDEQLTTLKETDGYLFVPETGEDKGHVAGAKPIGTQANSEPAMDETAQMISAMMADLK